MTLVLLTPVGLDAGTWDLCDLPGGDVVRHVFPGFGARPRSPEAPTMASLADEVAGTYEGPLDLAGVSMGGMVAQHVAVRHPDRVRSLLVACTGANADPTVMHRRAAAARTAGMAGVLADTLDRWFTPRALSAVPIPAGVASAREALLGLDAEAFADGWSAIATHDARAGLPAVRARTT
ncbi:MAG TPA: alpha/beta hydrolase, partial [Solirubrobacteraceae bacterium]|nr:alpha/beta hydrolase [Solirubrobacteraceae bacterium]